jgi:uncharacterized membrane protein
MELFFAQNHAPMTHIPIACAILATIAAIANLFYQRKELTWAWAMLVIIAFLAAFPAIITGTFAAVGRFYLEQPGIVENIPDNDPIAIHQRLGIAGAVIALILAIFGVRRLKGKENNRILILVFSLALAILWGYGGHLGGKTSWAPDTFPQYEYMLEDTGD